MESLEMLQLMQLADSALPLGGFAFSNGLEWMVKTGVLETRSSMEEYLKGILYQAVQFDLPFLNSFCGEHRIEALEEYNQLLYLPAQREFSITQGRAWLRLLPKLYQLCQSTELRKELRALKLPPHFLFVLGATMNKRVSDWKHLASLYLFMLVRDQISAGLRLGICGPSLAQELLSLCLPWSTELLEGVEIPEYKEAYRVTVLQDIALAGHQNLYSKLFQN